MIPLSPNEEQNHHSTHFTANRLRRLQEVRCQAREFQAAQLAEYRKTTTATAVAFTTDERRRQLLEKTAELQRLRAVRGQALRDLEAADREAQLQANRVAIKREIADIKINNFNNREAVRANQALAVDRAVKEAELKQENQRLADLIEAREIANGNAQEFRASAAAPSVGVVDVAGVLSNARRLERRNFRLLDLADQIPSDPPQPAKTATAPREQPMLAEEARRSVQAAKTLRTIETVKEISEELERVEEDVIKEKVEAIKQEQIRRRFRRPPAVKRRDGDVEVEIFVPKGPRPVEEELMPVQDALAAVPASPAASAASQASSRLSSASLDALVNRYSEILRNFQGRQRTAGEFNK